jgi:hypothetical protein
MIQAAATALAAAVPDNVSSELQPLDELAQAAYEKAKEAFDSGDLQARGSTCKWSEVRIRREW